MSGKAWQRWPAANRSAIFNNRPPEQQKLIFLEGWPWD
jgi:hypothetical protein